MKKSPDTGSQPEGAKMSLEGKGRCGGGGIYEEGQGGMWWYCPERCTGLRKGMPG